MVAIAAVIGLVITGGFILQSFIPPVKRHMDNSFNESWPNRYPPLADAIEMRRRGLVDEMTFNKYMKAEGFSTDRSTNLWKGSETLLSPDALLILNWREELSDQDFLAEMTKLGYSEEISLKFKSSRLFYPSPTDLVMWQAKEVFEPDAITKYGLKDEFEKVDLEAFKKAGMTENQALNYWLAHWQHPSLTIIWELQHRGLLTEADVYEYYRLVEIPPFWREKLTKISYKPYTRVDVRRMYSTGVLERDDVKRSYLDLGYDDEKAEKMTEFTIASTETKERDLSRTMIERGYEIGLINQVEALELIQELGYDQQESLVVLALKHYKIMQDELDDKIATIKSRYRRGFLDQTEAITALDKLEINGVYRDRVIAEIQRVKQTEFKLPSKEDLLGFHKKKIIDDSQFIHYMDRLGYQQPEIELFLGGLKA